MSRSTPYCIPLELSQTNDELMNVMRQCRHYRQQKGKCNVVCTIRGFDHDPREQCEIAEVRAFCRRLVGIGFISWLDTNTSIPAMGGIGMNAGLGAFEVWAIAEGLMPKPGGAAIPVETLKRFMEDLEKANREADMREAQ
jgi:hypothetical protein